MKTTIDIGKRYRMFSLKYLPATNTKPSRCKIKDLRFDKSKVISLNGDSMADKAIQYLESIGIQCQALAMGCNDCSVLTEDFDSTLV